MSSSAPLPSSILIIGAGVFGLSTAYALALSPHFTHTTITVIDRSPEPDVFPARDASSIDTSRIIRADYADPAYAALAAQAQQEWRKHDHTDDLGAQGRYTETGLLIVADPPRQAPSTVAVAADTHPVKKSGLDYARASYHNVRALHPDQAEKILLLPSRDAIRNAYGTGGATGSWGYLNRLSGWANAEASMAWLYRRVRATNRVTFVNGTVTSLLYSSSSSSLSNDDDDDDDNERTVTGVKLATGESHTASLTILATGAWTPALLPSLSGRAIATGQVLAYLPLTPAEQAQLRNLPTLLNISTGYFIITPAHNLLKIARHAYGYLHPNSTSTSTTSHPATHLTHPHLPSLVPPAELQALRAALRELLPWPDLADRPFSATRLCWYTDTADADFIVDYHPQHNGLFLATGGSGHGFKFLPVIGQRIVDVIMGRCPEAFRGKWAFAKKNGGEKKRWDQVVTEDGSRGGVPGLILDDELALSQGSMTLSLL